MLRPAIWIVPAIVFLLTILSSSAQVRKSFTIIESFVSTDIPFYEKSLSAANLEKYRLDAQRRVINFADGVKIALYSRKELLAIYGEWNEPNVMLSNTDLIYPNEFQLLPSGIVVERVPVIPAKK